MRKCNYLNKKAPALILQAIKQNTCNIYYYIEASHSGKTYYITSRLNFNGEMILLSREFKINVVGMRAEWAFLCDHLLAGLDQNIVMANEIHLIEF